VASAALGGILPGWDVSADAGNKSASRGFGGHAEGRHLIFRFEEEGIHGGFRTRKDRFRATERSYFRAGQDVKELICTSTGPQPICSLVVHPYAPRGHRGPVAPGAPRRPVKSANLLNAFRLMPGTRYPPDPVGPQGRSARDPLHDGLCHRTGLTPRQRSSS
jgi:hypothetical protein